MRGEEREGKGEEEGGGEKERKKEREILRNWLKSINYVIVGVV